MANDKKGGVAMQHVVIVGGTSGIGLALAKTHLAQNWQVTVIGSNREKIAALPHSLSEHTAFTAIICDITDSKQRAELLNQLASAIFNRLIYCAGKYHSERQHTLSRVETQAILGVNLQAFQSIFDWAGEYLQKSSAKEKHLMAIASVAGLLDFKDASLYAKCKRAMIATCDAYRMGLEPFDIQVTCIASGYVDTAQLRTLNGGNASNKPYLVSVEQAVTEIHHAIEHNIGLHIFPKPMARTVALLSMLPKPLLNTVMRMQYRHQDKKR